MHESMKQKVKNVTRTQHYIHYSTLITDTSTKYDPALRSGTDKQTKLRPARVSEHTLALGRQGEEHRSAQTQSHHFSLLSKSTEPE